MAKAKVQEDAPTVAAAPVGKVVFVNFVRRHAEKPEDERSHFDGPQGTTAGTATLLVGDDGQIVAAISKFITLAEGESIEVTAVRNVISDVAVPSEVDWS